MSRPRILTRELTQHSDSGPSSGFQVKTPVGFTQRFGASFGVRNDHTPNSPARSVQGTTFEGNTAWPYPQLQRHQEEQQYRVPLRTPIPNPASTFSRAPLPREQPSNARYNLTSHHIQESLEFIQPEDIPIQYSRDPLISRSFYTREASCHPRDSYRSHQTNRNTAEVMSRDTPSRQENSFDRIYSDRDGTTFRDPHQTSMFNTEHDDFKLNSMLGFERVFYGGVDQVLAWYHIIRDSPHPAAAVLFTITGCIESMVTKEESQVILLKGESHVLQCLYHVIDRMLPHLQPTSLVVVTGNMTGARKLIMHDMYPLEEGAGNLERMCYLSDRALSRYIATLSTNTS